MKKYIRQTNLDLDKDIKHKKKKIHTHTKCKHEHDFKDCYFDSFYNRHYSSHYGLKCAICGKYKYVTWLFFNKQPLKYNPNLPFYTIRGKDMKDKFFTADELNEIIDDLSKRIDFNADESDFENLFNIHRLQSYTYRRDRLLSEGKYEEGVNDETIDERAKNTEDTERTL